MTLESLIEEMFIGKHIEGPAHNKQAAFAGVVGGVEIGLDYDRDHIELAIYFDGGGCVEITKYQEFTLRATASNGD